MLQLKIIRIRGQCRGRPPTPGANRDGPWTVDSWQSAVDSFWSAVAGQRSPVSDPEIHFIRTVDWLSSVVSLSYGAKRSQDRKLVPESEVSSGSKVGRNAIVLLTADRRPPTIDRRPETGDRRPPTGDQRLTAKPRDWISATCSRDPINGKNRRNDIMAPRQATAEISGQEELCPKIYRSQIHTNEAQIPQIMKNVIHVTCKICDVVRENLRETHVVKFIMNNYNQRIPLGEIWT